MRARAALFIRAAGGEFDAEKARERRQRGAAAEKVSASSAGEKKSAGERKGKHQRDREFVHTKLISIPSIAAVTAFAKALQNAYANYADLHV